MSCETCNGCFTGSQCSSKANTHSRRLTLEKLLNQAPELKPGTDLQKHDHYLSILIQAMSEDVHASSTALLEAFRTLSWNDFIELCKFYVKYHITGSLIAWAHGFCNTSTDLLHVFKSSSLSSLLDHVDSQAEIHEVLNSLPKESMGRVKRPDAFVKD